MTNSGALPSPLDERYKAAMKALSAYFDSHVEEGESPCPCNACDLAREVFKAELRAIRREARGE